MTHAPTRPVTIREALLDARNSLPGDAVALEAEVLLMHALGTDRIHLYQRLNDPLSAEDSTTFDSLLARRANHEPLAYITGHREFFALAFEVTPAALIPRPETETLVELVIALARERFGGHPITIADVGTGSGVIAVSLATALPEADVIATDVSANALALARRNANRHGVSDRIDFRQTDLLSTIETPVQFIAANLPYVTTEQWSTSSPEIHDHEPRLALDGGPDGLDVIRRLLLEAPSNLANDGAIFCEIGDWQSDAARALAAKAFPCSRIEVAHDLAGRDRVLTLVRR